jgi:hypothetical protein
VRLGRSLDPSIVVSFAQAWKAADTARSWPVGGAGRGRQIGPRGEEVPPGVQSTELEGSAADFKRNLGIELLNRW